MQVVRSIKPILRLLCLQMPVLSDAKDVRPFRKLQLNAYMKSKDSDQAVKETCTGVFDNLEGLHDQLEMIFT